MNAHNRAYPNPNSAGRKRIPSLGQRMAGIPEMPSVRSGLAPATASTGTLPDISSGIASARPSVGPLSDIVNRSINDARMQTASMAQLRGNISQNPMVSTPARDAAMAMQGQRSADMQGIQQRLAASGNAQLGTAGRFSANDLLGDVPSSPFGRSEMPGVVTRGGVTNVVGQLSMSDILDQGVNDRASAAMKRKAEVKDRVTANNNRQLEANAARARELGLPSQGNYVGGGRYELQGGEGRTLPFSNLAVAKARMTPADRFNFDEQRASRDSELAIRKQRQFARAQFNEATAGRGVIYQDDGGLDLAGTMATRIAAMNNPTSMSVDPRTGQRSAAHRNQSAALQAILEQAENSELGRQAMLDALTEQADGQRDQANADRDFNENARQFDDKLRIEDILAQGEILDGKRKNRTAKRQMTLDDLLAQEKFQLEQQKAKELFRQGAFDRSDEPHKRAADLKRLMPSSIHQPMYLPPQR